MTSAPSTAADRLAARLAEAGCRLAFGIPGGEVLVLIEALERAGIRFVLTKHETAACFMAEGAWQMTGAPGVLVATVGPGLSNAVNGIVNAALDRVPLIVLSGCVDADDRLLYSHQIIDHGRLLEPAVKASFTLSAARADLITEKALRLARSPRPGPVHIDVPIKLAGAADEEPMRIRQPAPAPSAPADGPALETAWQWLSEAQRPLLIAGFDAVADDAGAALRRFVETHKVPVIQTYKAKGLLPEDHPMALASAALSPAADATLMPLIDGADLLILAGYDAVEMRTGWQQRWDIATKRVIELSAAANDHDMHASGIGFVCDSAAGLETLGVGASCASRWSEEEVADRRDAVRAPFRTDERWGPAAVCDVLRKVVPRDGVVTADSGAHRILLSQVWMCYEPRTLLQSNGLCTMGGALPLAMGAKIAAPERPAIAVMGDGGLLMVLGELATCAEQELPVILVVLIDRSLALIEKKQRESQLPKAGVTLGSIDLEAIATGFGGRAAIVGSRGELGIALRQAMAETRRFTIIGCGIDARDYDGRI